MLRIRVFQHVPHEGLGSLEAHFRTRGGAIGYTRFPEGDTAPEASTYDMLVIMGGPMGVYEEAIHPWLVAEKRAIRTALESGKTILGICLGAQLLAEVAGGVVTKNRHREIGWWPVERLPAVQSHWAAACFPERFRTFHWHGDTFSIPPGAISLFRSQGCEHQGFALGDRAVALQFHPEILPEVAESWIKAGAEELIAGTFVQTPEQIRGDPHDYAANNGWLAALCEKLLNQKP